MKFAVAALLGSASATLMEPAEYQFMNHIINQGLSYGTKAEYEFRYAIFKESLAEVERINNDPNETHTVELNFLSTWTTDEKAKLLGYRADNRTRNPVILDESNLADSVDWRTKDNADHAGLSPPLVLWRVLTSFPQANSSPSP